MTAAIILALVFAAVVAVLAVALARFASSLSASAREAAAGQAALVAPLFDQMRAELGAFREAAEKAQRENALLGATLKDRLADVGQKAQGLGRQAEAFVAALQGGSKAQGNWGEGILKQVLEEAGLREGDNFVAQAGSKTAGLPDVTVFDGVSRRILIDSKVNIDAFIASVNAAKEGDEASAARFAHEHARSVRVQVRALAERRYPEKLRAENPGCEYSPVVIMFLPSEATYACAVQADPSLVAYANGLDIVLASPQMLFGYLVLFKMGLDRLQADRNNAEIVQRANQILDRLDAAFAALDEVGKALEKATAKYHDALRKLGFEPGGQNIVTPARELARLANASKKRAAALLQP